MFYQWTSASSPAPKGLSRHLQTCSETHPHKTLLQRPKLGTAKARARQRTPRFQQKGVDPGVRRKKIPIITSEKQLRSWWQNERPHSIYLMQLTRENKQLLEGETMWTFFGNVPFQVTKCNSMFRITHCRFWWAFEVRKTRTPVSPLSQ